ncbi:pilus assembly protein TadG-related protein [Reyranella sp.]|uniref:pilus assembly protein TadG-related protein n=1 Tax=Reyranella sp. TaxID=1929291 RepID=UPI0025EFDFBE|nr:pilus assembly protein TadG-related protein [Reyranella sp.]
MKRLVSSGPEVLRRFLRNQRGSTTLIFAGMATAMVGLAGLTIDVGRAYSAKNGFDAATEAAALAGAYALQSPNANAASVQSAVNAWNAAHPAPNVTSSTATATLICVTSTANLPSCNGTSPNAVTVTQTATISTYFLKAFGFQSLTLASTKTASKAGGSATPLNVMFVLDATGSMGNSDNNCTVPGKSNPTRFECALYSIQSTLKVMPASMDKAGLMVFPGLASQYSPTSHPCPTYPSSVPYYTSTIKYQIGTTLDSTYNDNAGALVNSSPLVQAVGNGTSLTPCVTNRGGQGSYLAEVLIKAQAALPIVAGTKNVIIILSDGDFNASLSQLNNQSTYLKGQCDRAIAAAQAATAAGTQVFSVAYGASTSGCSSGDTHNPCTTMQSLASDSSKFYTTSSTCQLNGSPNPPSKLPSVFQAITSQLTKPRMLVN